ncbi:hypothetical protein GS504_03200 [Rhodococcus hoagii]|nr:hypothetical protein [Prescottella equi]
MKNDGTPIYSAAVALADQLANLDLAHILAQELTCSEVDAVAALLDASGYNREADMWRKTHAEGDAPGDDHYTGTPNTL